MSDNWYYDYGFDYPYPYDYEYTHWCNDYDWDSEYADDYWLNYCKDYLGYFDDSQHADNDEHNFDPFDLGDFYPEYWYDDKYWSYPWYDSEDQDYYWNWFDDSGSDNDSERDGSGSDGSGSSDSTDSGFFNYSYWLNLVPDDISTYYWGGIDYSES